MPVDATGAPPCCITPWSSQVIAVIAALLGFTGIAGTAAWIAKLLFVLFLILAVIAFFRRADWTAGDWFSQLRGKPLE
jgi:uncharacterized membrane protein YtjA (UPF0391 family)